ncbi:organic cation/carnitine transporter 2-like isoform X2 [Clavelina lepadiformis]|uniref:organic cation/carnitine transporter 2-like isoform X2 n=1 Tax=Clavelina lepadiformis TaxID=159417 RepID=UPI004041EF04
MSQEVPKESLKKQTSELWKLFAFERYQKRLCLLLFLATFPNAFSGLQFLIIHFTPTYECSRMMETVKNETESFPFVKYSRVVDKNGNKDPCFMHNVLASKYFTTTAEANRSVNETPVVNCDKIRYNSIYTSAVTEFDMICENAWKKHFLVSLYMVGKAVGGQFGGVLSDRFGRRPVFLFFTFLQFVASFLTSFAWNFTSYAIITFLSGTTAVVNFYAAMLLGNEAVEPSKRNLMYFATESGFACGYMIMPLVGKFISDWRWFLRFSAFIGIIYIPYYWLIDETPIWLLANNRTEDAKLLFAKILKMNKIEVSLSETDLKELKSLLKHGSAKNEPSNVMLHYKKLCKSPILLWRLFILSYTWAVVSMSYYVIALNNDNLSGDRFLNIFYAGLVEAASGVFFFAGSTKMGAHNAFMLMMIVDGLLLGCIPLLASWSGKAVLVFTMLSKLLVSIAYNLVILYTGDVFPTTSRHSVIGLVDAFSRLGGICAPFIIFAGENGNTLASSIGMGIAIFVSGLLFCFLPNTKNTPLPNTVEEAIKMKSVISIWYHQICNKKSVPTEDHFADAFEGQSV